MLGHSFPPYFYREYEEEWLCLYWKTLKEHLPKDSGKLKFGDFKVGYGLANIIALCKCVIACESLTKMNQNSDEFKLKLKINMNGLESTLRAIESMHVIDLFDDLISGKLKHSSLENRQRISMTVVHAESKALLETDELSIRRDEHNNEHDDEHDGEQDDNNKEYEEPTEGSTWPPVQAYQAPRRSTREQHPPPKTHRTSIHFWDD